MAIPVQEIFADDDNLWIFGCIFAIWIPYLVLLPYINMTDALSPTQRRNKTYDKLKFLPVSKKQYRIVRMGYLFRYLWKLTATGLVVQCVVAMILLGKISVWNILYVVAILFVLPFFCGWVILLEC